VNHLTTGWGSAQQAKANSRRRGEGGHRPPRGFGSRVCAQSDAPEAEIIGAGLDRLLSSTDVVESSADASSRALNRSTSARSRGFARWRSWPSRSPRAVHSCSHCSYASCPLHSGRTASSSLRVWSPTFSSRRPPVPLSFKLGPSGEPSHAPLLLRTTTSPTRARLVVMSHRSPTPTDASSSRAEGQPAYTGAKVALPVGQQQAPGGPVIGGGAKPQSVKSPTWGVQQARSPPPAAQPVKKTPSNAGGSRTLPLQGSSSSAASSARSPSPATSATLPGPLASSSLASFYGSAASDDVGEEKHDDEDEEATGGRSGTTASMERTTAARATSGSSKSSTLGVPRIDTSGEEGQTGPSSASAFYASLAGGHASAAAGTASKPGSPINPSEMFLQTAEGGELDLGLHSPSPVANSHVPSVLATIAARFDNPPINLAASSKRTLIKEGFLQRQATFKNVERYVYIFTDLMIVTEPAVKNASSSASLASASKLTMKNIVPLESATVIEGKNAKIFIVLSEDGGKDLYFEGRTEKEAAEWSTALKQAISSYKSVAPKPVVPSSVNETLFTAIAKKDDQALLYLLSERNDDPNALDPSGQTPLHAATYNGFIIGVTLLLSHGADMTLQNADGKTPLHLAALRDEYAILLTYLSRRPSIDSLLDLDGRSPVWDLVGGPYRMNERLVEEHVGSLGGGIGGAVAGSPMSKKGKMKRPIQSSPRASDSEEEGASDEDDDDDDDESVGAASPLSPSEKDLRSRETAQRHSWKHLVECLNVMLDENGASLEEKDRSGKTLLMHLAATHQFEALELIISKGASLSMIDDRGATALHYAVCGLLSNGQVEESDLGDVIRTVQLLLQHGICPNLHDHSGSTPLHLCRSLPIAGCLLVHGARPDLKNDKGVKAGAYFEDLQAKGDVNDPVQAMKDAREQWLQRPDTFLPPEEDLETQTWLNDELSDCCLLCAEKFSLTKRRHHCRRCGMLICANCGSKKFTHLRKKEEGLRACDPCYNIMAQKYLVHARKQRKIHAKKREEEQRIAADKAQLARDFELSHKAFLSRNKEMEARNAEKAARMEHNKNNPDDQLPPPKATKRASASSAAGSSSSSSSSAPIDKTAAVSKLSAGTNEKMQQNRQLALERGEKLSRLEDKASKMEADAENFASMAAKLKQREKDRWF
jgi:ankyrin repeat protein